MESLSDTLRQIARIYRRLSPSQRVTFLLLILMIAGSLVLLVVLGGGGEWVRLTAGPLTDRQFSRAAAALERAGIEYRERFGTLQVRRTDRYRALAALSQANALPATGTDFGWNQLLHQTDSITRMRTPEQQRLQELIALQTELARTLCEFRGVANARVMLSHSPRRTLDIRSRSQQKASVTLWLEPGAELTPNLVRSVVNLVQGAVLDLKPHNITVIDATHGVCRRLPEEESLFAGDLLEQKRAVERYLRKKLYDSLAFIPNLIADVSVVLRPQRERRVTEKVDPENSVIPRRTVERSEKKGTAQPPSATPAVGTSGGAALTPPSTTGSSLEETTDEVLGEAYTRERGELVIPAGTIERISAVVVVPLEYYRKMEEKSLPPGQKVDERQVLARANADRERIRQLVQKALGPKAKPEDITVDTRFIPSAPEVAKVGAGGAVGGAAGLVERYGPAAVLVGLSVVFLMLLGRWVKRPGEAAAREAASPASPTGSSDSPILETTTSPEVKRQEEMLKRIEEMVKQDPDNAANIVLRWLNQG